MSRFFLTPAGIYYETNADVAPGDAPTDHQEVSQRPTPDHQWQSGAWVHVAPVPRPIGERRADMILSRRALFKALRDAEIITPAEAVAACLQGVIPPSLEPTIAAMPEPYQSDVRMDFGDFKEAHRLHPLVSMMAALHAPPLSESEVDALFENNMP